MSQQSVFDPESFLDTEVPEELSTEITPVPEYDAVPGMVKPGSLTVRQHYNAEKDHTSTILNLDWVVDDQEARDVTGRPEPTVRQTIFLDLDANGSISTEKGKNVALGRVYEAVGLNGKKPTLRMLEGRAAKLRIRHQMANIGGMEVKVAEVRGVISLDS